MPCDGLSFAILIGSQPDEIRSVGLGFQFLDYRTFIGRDHVFRLVVVLYIYTEFIGLEVADVSVTREYCIIRTEETSYRFGFCRRLYDD